MLDVKTALDQGTEILSKAAVPVARFTAEVLLCHALQQDRTYVYAHGEDKLTELAWIHYGRYLNERLKGKPTQYITHKQEFYGRDFYVNEDVLIPRPETEHLVEAARAYVKKRGAAQVLDVGTGSGAIAISVALESGARVLASAIAKLGAAVQFFAADLLDALRPASVDLLVSNPPYVPGGDRANMQSEVRDWEPHLALFAGDSGLEIYSRLLAGASQVVKRGGRLLMELGYQSLAGVREMLAAEWSDIEVIPDLAGWPRVIGATLTR